MTLSEVKSIMLPLPLVTLIAGCGKEAEPGNIMAKIPYRLHPSSIYMQQQTNSSSLSMHLLVSESLPCYQRTNIQWTKLPSLSIINQEKIK